MILVDTPIWIEHLRTGHRALSAWLAQGVVVHHPFVTAEIASGYLKNRAEILRLFGRLPSLVLITQDEYLYFVEQHELMGKGLGMVDIHLLGAARAANARVATLDHALGRAAKTVGISI